MVGRCTEAVGTCCVVGGRTDIVGFCVCVVGRRSEAGGFCVVWWESVLKVAGFVLCGGKAY